MELAIQDFQHPIIAILTMEDGERDFRGNRENFVDIIRTGQKLGMFVYVVAAKDLKLSSRRVIGFTYSHDEKNWTRKWVPLPHIVYNRIPFREDELQSNVQRVIQDCLNHPRIHLFNPAFFNKWNLFEWLRKSKKTRKYIPMTKRMNSSINLSRVLKRHSLVYLKPVRGKAGSGIMCVKRNNQKRLKYHLSIQEARKIQTFQYANLPTLWKKIAFYMHDEQYIVQQGINLSHIDQRPFDLRVLIQKNSRGKWMLTGVGARIAGSHNITTHVPRGGSIDDPRKLLISTFGKSVARRIMLRAKYTALTIAKQIEISSGYNHGEMSMDLGVDTKGQVWFFEANAKPMKFDEPHIRQKSLERMFHYFKYLSQTKRSKERR